MSCEDSMIEEKSRINMTLRDVYRTADISRWHMVKTRRQQSVAEHSFLVAMIAMRACEIMKITDSMFIGYLIQKAMFHDLPEVYMGDIPTPAKKFLLPEVAEQEIKRFENRVWFADYSVSMNHFRYAERAEDIVKLADIVEAIAFLDGNGEGPYALDAMARLMRVAYERWPDVAQQLVWELTQGTIQNMESLTGEA